MKFIIWMNNSINLNFNIWINGIDAHWLGRRMRSICIFILFQWGICGMIEKQIRTQHKHCNVNWLNWVILLIDFLKFFFIDPFWYKIDNYRLDENYYSIEIWNCRENPIFATNYSSIPEVNIVMHFNKSKLLNLLIETLVTNFKRFVFNLYSKKINILSTGKHTVATASTAELNMFP